MYGTSSAGDGRPVKRWETPGHVGSAGGTVVASMTMRDGRTYRLVGCVGNGEVAKCLTPNVQVVVLRREVAEQMDLLLAWDDAAS